MCDFRAVGLFSALVSSTAVTIVQSVEPTRATPPSEIAQQLADRGLVVDVPAKGKAKAEFKKGAPTYPLTGGASPAVMMRLPLYQAPYTLTVSSNRHGAGRTTEIFVPSLLFLDDHYQLRSGFGDVEAPSVSRSQQWGVMDKIYKDFTIDNAAEAYRFVLVFTRVDASGEKVPEASGPIARGVLGLMHAKVERSLEGTVEFVTRPIKAKKP